MIDTNKQVVHLNDPAAGYADTEAPITAFTNAGAPARTRWSWRSKSDRLEFRYTDLHSQLVSKGYSFADMTGWVSAAESTYCPG
jgi:hypothetical protein